MTVTRNFDYNGTNIAFNTIGEGKPLILLHGWGVSSEVLQPLAGQLSALRTCYLIDLPGFGSSPPPPKPWSIDDYADAIEAFITEYCNEPIDILAHSFGGRITLKMCAQQKTSTQIDKVLITGGAGMKPNRSLVFYLKKYTAKFLKMPFSLLPGPLSDNALKWLRSTPVWKSLGSSDYRQLSGVMRKTFVQTVSEYLEPCLPNIKHEVLLLWGVDDNATPLYQAERMEGGLKNAALVTIDKAGHYAFLDRPQKFTAIAKAFFQHE